MIINSSQENRNTFNQLRYFNNPPSYEDIFECTVCGCKTSLDGSYSNQGKNLICISCSKKKFKAPNELWEFLDGGIIDEDKKCSCQSSC